MFSFPTTESSYDAGCAPLETEAAPGSELQIKKEIEHAPFSKHAWDNQAPLWQGLYAVKQEQDKPYKKPRSYLAAANIPKKYRRPLKQQIDKYKELDSQAREKFLNERMKEVVCNGVPELDGQYGVIAARDIAPYQLLGHYAGWVMSETEYEQQSSNKTTQIAATLIDTYALALPDGHFLSGYRYGNVTTRINANTIHESKEIKQVANVAILGHKDNNRWLVCLYSLDNIAKSTPLLFDYGRAYWNSKRQIVDLSGREEDKNSVNSDNSDCTSTTKDTLTHTADDQSDNSDIERKCSKKHVCHYCQAGFTLQSYLKKHMQTHAEKVIHQSASSELPCSTSQNMRIYKPLKSHICTICNKVFFKTSSLKDHHRSHTGEKPYACETCGKHFSQMCNLKRHQRTHTNERPYACTTCGKHFNQPYYLQRHQLLHKKRK